MLNIFPSKTSIQKHGGDRPLIKKICKKKKNLEKNQISAPSETSPLILHIERIDHGYTI